MRWTIMLAALAVGATACGGGETADPPVGDWQLVGGVPLVDDHPITVSIGTGEISGRAACNSFFGRVYPGEIGSGGSGIGFGELGQTEMGCEPAVMASESAFLAALVAVERFELEENGLTLFGTMGDLEFEPVVPVPTEELVGTVWVLDTLIEGESVSTVGGGEATLVLGPDGGLRASTGCRVLTGRWLESAGAIVVPELAAEGDCPAELARQDSLVVTVIGDEFRAQVEGDRLTLSSMGGDGLGYRAER